MVRPDVAQAATYTVCGGWVRELAVHSTFSWRPYQSRRGQPARPDAAWPCCLAGRASESACGVVSVMVRTDPDRRPAWGGWVGSPSWGVRFLGRGCVASVAAYGMAAGLSPVPAERDAGVEGRDSAGAR
jgi:hypothetical protein